MQTTTIKLQVRTKQQLDTLREKPSETYEEIIQKLMYIAKKLRSEPQLSQATVQAIQEARERMDKGQFLTHEQAAKRLGLACSTSSTTKKR